MVQVRLQRHKHPVRCFSGGDQEIIKINIKQAAGGQGCKKKQTGAST